VDTILGILLGASYSDIHALVDLFCALINTNKLYGAVVEETIARLTTNLA
jgi:hypothetical protein